jgi:hypothetical protein
MKKAFSIFVLSLLAVSSAPAAEMNIWCHDGAYREVDSWFEIELTGPGRSGKYTLSTFHVADGERKETEKLDLVEDPNQELSSTFKNEDGNFSVTFDPGEEGGATIIDERPEATEKFSAYPVCEWN